MFLTYRYRVKNLHGELNRMARAINFVWNYCNDAQRHAVKWNRKWPTAFDLCYKTAGVSVDLRIPATTVNLICAQYARSRGQHRKAWLRFRGRKSLGWVPVRSEAVSRIADGIRFAGKKYKMFMSRPLPPGAVIKDGSSFSQDARGRWHLNLCIETPDAPQPNTCIAVGIDLGLKDLAALSTGEKVANPRHVANLAQKLAKAQRARKKRLAATIYAKISNARRDHLHKASRAIVNQFDYIAVGNVNAAGLVKTSMARSVLDASWTSFRNMLRYKAIGRGGWYEEVNERMTTQTCSRCGVIPDSSPKGMGALGIREWKCSDCGAVHDRDHNSAINILLRSGHRALVEGAAA